LSLGQAHTQSGNEEKEAKRSEQASSRHSEPTFLAFVRQNGHYFTRSINDKNDPRHPIVETAFMNQIFTKKSHQDIDEFVSKG
jgi:hypothetical protein